MVLNYDILDDLDARQSNAVQKVIDEDDVPVVLPTVAEFYEAMTQAECSHMLIVTVQLDDWIDIDDLKESMNTVVHRFFPDVPDVQMTYVNISASTAISFMSEWTLQDCEDFGLRDEFLERLQDKLTFSALFKIPVKVPYVCTEHWIRKLLNFMASLRGTYWKYKDTKIGRMLVWKLYEDGPYEKPKMLDAIGHVFNFKFRGRESSHLNDYINVREVCISIRTFFEDSDDLIARVVQEWCRKYCPNALKGGIYTPTQLNTFYENYKLIGERRIDDLTQTYKQFIWR